MIYKIILRIVMKFRSFISRFQDEERLPPPNIRCMRRNQRFSHYTEY